MKRANIPVNWQKKILLIVALFCGSQLISQNNKVIDSLLSILQAKEDTNRCRILMKLASQYSKFDTEKAIDYSHQGLELARKLKNEKWMNDAYYKLGMYLRHSADYKSALAYLDSSVILTKKDNDEKGLAQIYNAYGNIYNEMEDYQKSISSFIESIRIKEKLNLTGSLANSYLNLGNVYNRVNLLEKAEEYFRKGYDLKRKEEDEYGMAGASNLIAVIYNRRQQYKKALTIYTEAFKLVEDDSDAQLMASLSGNMAETYIGLKDYAKAEDLTRKCLAYRKMLGDVIGMAYSYSSLSEILLYQNKHEESITFADSCLYYSRQSGYTEGLYYGYMNLSRSYAEQGNYNKAYSYLLESNKALDSLNVLESQNMMANVEAKYQDEKKENTIKLANEKMKGQEAEIKRQNQQKIFMGIGTGLFALLALFIFNGYHQKKKSNEIITRRNAEVHAQKEIIEVKQKEILDSINYAKRLQEAILPNTDLIKKYFPESFLLYLPKDIVAGDFYWFERTAGSRPGVSNLFIAACDCTGHGVPGAIVSIVCSNALNAAVKEFHLSDPGKILDKVRELVLETFEKSDKDVKDGMDISLLSIETTSNIEHQTSNLIRWAGANNPLWYTDGSEFHAVGAHKQPIGKTDDPTNFPTHQIDIKENGWFYLFTDGYADQFGGPKGKKFKYKNLQQLLFANKNEKPDDQQAMLNKAFQDWKGTLEQIDDVCILGIRV